MVSVYLDPSVSEHLLEPLLAEFGKHLESIVQGKAVFATLESFADKCLSALSIEIVPGTPIWTKNLLLWLLLPDREYCWDRSNENLRAHLKRLRALLLDCAEKVKILLLLRHFIVKYWCFVKLVLSNCQSTERSNIWQAVQIYLGDQRNLSSRLAEDLVAIGSQMR